MDGFIDPFADTSATPALVPTQSAQVTAPTVQGLNTQLFDFARTGNEAGVAQILSMLAEANAVKKAVQMGQDQNMTALHLAAQGGHAGVARLLMQNGASVNAKTVMGQTPLDLAKAGGHTELQNMLTIAAMGSSGGASNGGAPAPSVASGIVDPFGGVMQTAMGGAGAGAGVGDDFIDPFSSTPAAPPPAPASNALDPFAVAPAPAPPPIDDVFGLSSAPESAAPLDMADQDALFGAPEPAKPAPSPRSRSSSNGGGAAAARLAQRQASMEANATESRYGWDKAVANPNRAKQAQKEASAGTKKEKAKKKSKAARAMSLMKKQSSNDSDDDEDDEDEYLAVEAELEAEEEDGADIYLAELEKSSRDQKMGLVMERADALKKAARNQDEFDQPSPHLGNGAGSSNGASGVADETPYVKVVVSNTSAERAGITIGSTLVEIDGDPIKGKGYNECIAQIREKWSTGDGIVLKFKRGSVKGQEGYQGDVMARVSGGAFSVGGLRPGQAMYKNKFYAFGGPQTDYLQLFETKEQYHRCLIQAYENRVDPSLKMMTFHITKEHRCGRIKHKSYRLQGPLYYFKLKVPSLAFVPAKFASTNRMEVEALRNTIVRTIARAKRATMQQSQW